VCVVPRSILNGGIGKMNCAAESSISIYLLVQNRLVLDVFMRLFRKRTGFTVVGDSNDVAEALAELAGRPCDVLLLHSLEALRSVGQWVETAGELRKIKVVLFGMEEDPEYFLQAVRLGVCGYLLNDASLVEMIAAVRAVAQGEAICPAKLCKTLFDYVSRVSRPQSEKVKPRRHAASGLTCRQRQLMQLVAKGMTNKEIAASLQLSEFTIKNHIHRIMAHLQADSRHQAVDLIRTGGLMLSA
jgi:DNA-binding NarL/FixJ family response regulator